jgi:hypothetical protein
MIQVAHQGAVPQLVQGMQQSQAVYAAGDAQHQPLRRIQAAIIPKDLGQVFEFHRFVIIA